MNRNKKSVGVSFAHPSGVEILHRLAQDCDVLVENYLPGGLKKYGMDYATFAKTGRGQQIDLALSDCQTATLANIASSALISGKKDTGRWGTAHPSIVPYRAFETKDGDILVGGGNDRLYGVLCEKLGKPEWIKDERFSTNALRVTNREVLEEMIKEVTKTKTTEEWLDLLHGSGMPYAPINDVQTTLNLEHCTFVSSSMFQTLTKSSARAEYGSRSGASSLWAYEACQHARQVLRIET